VQLSTRAIDRFRTSADASHYLLIPDAVATPRDAEEVAELFAYASKNKTSITFRSGGTSLSGQSVTNGILVDTRRNFRNIEVLDGGLRVKVQPGVTVRAVNARLARFSRKLGPDPASEIACTIGGVIANNSSGMACGITQNTYQTLESAVVVLANGAIIDTSSEHADQILQNTYPELFNELTSIISGVNTRVDLVEQINSQYHIKNTMGYGLNSLTDYRSVIDVLLHLMVGSEGTLGFIAEATFRTVPLLSAAATALKVYPTLLDATQALGALIETGPATIELMDAASLRASNVDIGGVKIANQAAFLIEYQAENEDALNQKIKGLSGLELTTDKKVRDSLWHIRKELYATVAGARRSGTTALLEDIAVPVSQLAQTCTGLQELFTRHGYDDAVIFGHAKDGNIHFLINEDFSDALKAERYHKFTEGMISLVLSQKGSLKAEHGTGRMMAPFVERQFGSELYQLMKRIKNAFDPANVLNPGVLISSDSDAHMRNIKFNPPINQVADNCVECGYCEPICPSKDLTVTPRQRIVISRAIASSYAQNDLKLYNELLSQSTYDVKETCAVDGLCATTCPLGINTGELVQDLRAEKSAGLGKFYWSVASKSWGKNLGQVSAVMSIAQILPASLVLFVNKILRVLVGADSLPLWSKDLPRGGKKRESISQPNPEFVFFTSCLDTMFSSQTAISLRSLAKKAGVNFLIPEGIGDLCCSTPWKSKGILDSYEVMAEKTYQALLAASSHGKLPIVCENSSCSEGLLNVLRNRKDSELTIIDSVDFAAQRLLPRLSMKEKIKSVVLHPTCSSTALGSDANLKMIAAAISPDVMIPETWGCCGFAGDRGMLHPELTASATHVQAEEIREKQFDAYLSTNLTCEIGMSRATGQKYEHILCALDRLSN
jgi:D-lactate dehydrogenase